MVMRHILDKSHVAMDYSAGYLELLRSVPASRHALDGLIATSSVNGANVPPWLLAEGGPALFSFPPPVTHCELFKVL